MGKLAQRKNDAIIFFSSPRATRVVLKAATFTIIKFYDSFQTQKQIGKKNGFRKEKIDNLPTTIRRYVNDFERRL